MIWKSKKTNKHKCLTSAKVPSIPNLNPKTNLALTHSVSLKSQISLFHKSGVELRDKTPWDSTGRAAASRWLIQQNNSMCFKYTKTQKVNHLKAQVIIFTWCVPGIVSSLCPMAPTQHTIPHKSVPFFCILLFSARFLYETYVILSLDLYSWSLGAFFLSLLSNFPRLCHWSSCAPRQVCRIKKN